MECKKVFKTVGSVAKGAFEILSTVVVAGLVLASKTDDKGSVTYNDAVKAVMSSSLWSSDKPRVLEAIKPNFKPVVYEAIVEVVKSSMWNSDKPDVIIRMCKQAEESN